MKIALAALTLSLGAAGCASSSGDAGTPTFGGAPFATIQSDTGALSIEVRTWPAQPPDRGESAVQFTVVRGGAPDSALAFTPELWMPDMDHGASTEPTVEIDGAGVYVFDACELFMPGRWQLRTTIAGDVDDSAVAEFEIP
jgi:hypothetical protein